MKALSLWQPWASLIADGRKTIETRDWKFSHRGLLAIHAAKAIDKYAAIDFGYDPKTIPGGAVLCIVEVVTCVQFPHPYATPDAYGDFSDGRYGFILKLREVFPTPIPAKGYQGVWYWNYENTKKEKTCNDKPLTQG